MKQGSKESSDPRLAVELKLLEIPDLKDQRVEARIRTSEIGDCSGSMDLLVPSSTDQ